MALNAFAIKPELATPFPNVPDVWTCPITGMKVPKHPIKNLAWRSELLAAAEKDTGLQKELYTAAGLSLLFWVNAFAFTFRVFEEDKERTGKIQQADHADLPYVTWDIQDGHLLKIEDAINNARSLLTDKTRDMGATWNHIAVFHHQWLFKRGRLFIEMSRVESDVDGADNPRCLFVKHDYLNKWLPAWMLPQMKRTTLHIVNLDNESRIDGESSNKAAASSARVHAMLLDEFAKMENAEKIKSSTADVAPCRLPNSTPFGPGTAFSKWTQSGQVEVYRLPWWEHPEKGFGRYVVQNESDKKWMIRSPWYDEQEKNRSPKEMAQEIDMDHLGSGNTYFESHIIEQHKRMFARKPRFSMTIDFKKEVPLNRMPRVIQRSQHSEVDAKTKGPWRFWTHLVNGRPDQALNYIIGCDISKGMGASNSVASILCTETLEKIGEFADANTPPHDFARIVCAAAIWIGGARKNGKPLLIWEANGDPGWNFGREIMRKMQYPFYFTDRTVGKVVDKRTKRYGWHSTPEKKGNALGLYRRALAHGGIVNHSTEALDEAMTYITYNSGGIGPAGLTEENANARKTHGDRVIADMLTLVGIGDSPRTRKPLIDAPHRSIGYRMAAKKRARFQEARTKNRRFDFRPGSKVLNHAY